MIATAICLIALLFIDDKQEYDILTGIRRMSAQERASSGRAWVRLTE